jgi:hypothetical protein
MRTSIRYSRKQPVAVFADTAQQKNLSYNSKKTSSNEQLNITTTEVFYLSSARTPISTSHCRAKSFTRSDYCDPLLSNSTRSCCKDDKSSNEDSDLNRSLKRSSSLVSVKLEDKNPKSKILSDTGKNSESISNAEDCSSIYALDSINMNSVDLMIEALISDKAANSYEIDDDLPTTSPLLGKR